jgi:hypothetical protein
MAKDGVRGSVQTTARIKYWASVGLVSDPKGSPNLLAYNGDGY